MKFVDFEIATENVLIFLVFFSQPVTHKTFGLSKLFATLLGHCKKSKLIILYIDTFGKTAVATAVVLFKFTGRRHSGVSTIFVTPN